MGGRERAAPAASRSRVLAWTAVMAAAATGVGMAQAFFLLPQQHVAAPATGGGGAMTAARLVGRARGGGGAATVVVARTAAAAAAAASPEGGGFDDEDEDVRFSMSSKHIDTGFLKREKAAPLWEDPKLMTAEALNEIFAPDEKENIMLLRSMWTASCIFRLDGILVDSLDVHARVWERVAQAIDAPMPSMAQVSESLHMSPEEAVAKVFHWTEPVPELSLDGPSSSSGSSSSSSSRQEAHRVSQLFDEIALEEFAKEEEGGRLNPLPGAVEVVSDMLESEIPSAVISNLPLEVIEAVLEAIGLKEMVECIETYDDRLKTEGQLLLNACLELERPPRHACFFDFSAIGIDAAHDNDMRAVALDGLYYQEMEINQCDAKVTRLSDWTLPRFRQLIERFPFDEQYRTVTAMAAARAPVKRKTAVGLFDEYRYEKGPDGKLRPTPEYLATEAKRVEQRERRLKRGKGLPEGSAFLSRGGKRAAAAPDGDEEAE